MDSLRKRKGTIKPIGVIKGGEKNEKILFFSTK